MHPRRPLATSVSSRLARRAKVGARALAALATIAFAAPAPGQSSTTSDRPPVLLQLGAVPAAVPVVTIGATAAPVAPAIPAGAGAIVLRADRDTPMAVVQHALDAARGAGVATVHFAAQLPDGTPGVLTLALPAAGLAPAPTVTLRAHGGRAGVPPESAVPLLRRLGDGWRAHGKGPFVLGIDVPANATHGQLLGLLAAGVAAGVPSAFVGTTDALAARPGALALDLESAFVLQVQPREQAAPAAGIVPELGATTTPPATAVALPAGRVGGKYGGRGAGGNAPANDELLRTSLDRAIAWLLRQQRADGSLPDAHGRGDVEATALLTLVLLGTGRSLDGGDESAAVRRSIGWLLARQHDDGRFADAGPDAVRHHALATWALTEGAHLSPRGALFRPCAQAALDWLFTQRRPDGGFSDGTPGAASDARSTASAATAVASASFFGADAPAPTAEIVAWFDDHRTQSSELAGVELFARHFAGHDPKAAPMPSLADAAATANAAQPDTCFWTTYALFQTGGAHWRTWIERLANDVAAAQVATGPEVGSWPAPGGDRAARGAATARFALALASYYRYARLRR